MRNWKNLLVSALGICLLAMAAFAQPDPNVVTVKGKLSFDNGIPFAGTSVTITVNDQSFDFYTDEQGAFTGDIIAGKATVKARGFSQDITLLPAQANTLDLSVKLTGVLLAMAFPDKTAAELPIYNILGASKYADAELDASYLDGVSIGKGQYWFPEVTAEATDFAVMANIGSDLGVARMYRQQWKLGQPAPLRKVILTVNKAQPLRLLLVDGQGKPVADKEVRGRIAYPMVDIDDGAFWSTEALQPRWARTQIGGLQTDKDGMLEFGMVPAQQYQITLIAGEAVGLPTTVDVLQNGLINPKKYQAALQTRTVTQTVIGTNGKPAANTDVSLVYTWEQQATLVRARTDAAGKVAWGKIPPVRAIMWGNGVAAGVIPADAVSITKALPPVIPGDSVYMNVSITNADKKVKRLHWAAEGMELYGFSDNMDVEEGEEIPAPSAEGQATAGTPFSVVAITEQEPPMIAMLANVYMPYADFDEQTAFTMTLQDGLIVRGRLATAQGPVIAVSQLSVLPVDTTAFPAIFLENSELRAAGMLIPQEEANGSFRVLVPGAGKYRMLVDLYNAASATPPGMVFEAKPGMASPTILLPAPLATVPAGTEFHWVTKTAPANTQTLVAPALQAEMPIFGPRDALLAYWYRPSPDKLALWSAIDGKPLRTLALRTTELLLKPHEGHDHATNFTIAPMLPVPMQEAGNGYTLPAGHANSEGHATGVSQGRGGRVNLWPGKYAIDLGFGPQLIDVPQDVKRTLEIDPLETQPQQGGSRSLRINLPTADYDALREKGSENITTHFDTPGSGIGTNIYANGNDEQWLEGPARAKSITIQWLGVGVIKDVPLPTQQPDEETPLLKLPAWEPGIMVSGRILLPDGKPLVNGILQIGANLSQYGTVIERTTDATGAFAVSGLLPGTLYIAQGGEGGTMGGWTLTVPAQGLKDITLKISETPISINTNTDEMGDGNSVWWFPDGGKPMLVPVRYGQVSSYEMTAGAGWLWYVDNARGFAKYTRFTATPGEHYLPQTAAGATSLGLIIPLTTPEISMPGAVTLQGIGDRAGVKAVFGSPQWQVVPMLGMIATQITAVPPGQYQLTVETALGRISVLTEVTEQGGQAQIELPAR